jgi:hypothetical protein
VHNTVITLYQQCIDSDHAAAVPYLQQVGVLFGSPETTSGGNALKFYASQRVDVRVREKIMGPDKVETGVRVKAKVVKNKVAPPYRCGCGCCISSSSRRRRLAITMPGSVQSRVVLLPTNPKKQLGCPHVRVIDVADSAQSTV